MKHRMRPIYSALLATIATASLACTGISLQSRDQGVVAARTVEWSLSDAQHYRIAVFPRTKTYTSLTPEGANGMQWGGRYGFLSMTAYGQDYGPDGLNEAGLYVGMYYLPGFADYAPFDPQQKSKSLSVGDFMQWMLSSFKTVDEVRTQLSSVRVINVKDERFGGAALPFHWKVSDPTGKSIVIELVNGGEMKVYDAFQGVITNSPTYDWHLTNMRNYLSMTPEANKPLAVGDLNLTPLGAGSGMLGLPGDYTPPSRFIRAAALTASARPLDTSKDAVFEAFRILDNFNIPLGATVPRSTMPKDITSATQITTAADLKERVFYYHTMFNRDVRMIDLKKIDFGTVKQQIIDDDSERRNAVRELMPRP
jgi:choloylglycine hydrolase